VFVDPLYVPYNFPLIGGEHVVYYDNHNQTDLWFKLDYYRSNPLEARRVAVSGYLFAMKYHRTVSITDYILRSAHLKQALLHNAHAQHTHTQTQTLQPTVLHPPMYGAYIGVPPVPPEPPVPPPPTVPEPPMYVSPPVPVPQYLYTAQYLNYEASQQEKAMVKCSQAGQFLQMRHTNGTPSVAERVTCDLNMGGLAADSNFSKKHLHAGNIKIARTRRKR
jgi:hypothetical protein